MCRNGEGGRAWGLPHSELLPDGAVSAERVKALAGWESTLPRKLRGSFYKGGVLYISWGQPILGQLQWLFCISIDQSFVTLTPGYGGLGVTVWLRHLWA